MSVLYARGRSTTTEQRLHSHHSRNCEACQVVCKCWSWQDPVDWWWTFGMYSSLLLVIPFGLTLIHQKVRKDIEDITEQLGKIEGISTLAITTNGITLAKKLPRLQKAGLNLIVCSGCSCLAQANSSPSSHSIYRTLALIPSILRSLCWLQEDKDGRRSWNP